MLGASIAHQIRNAATGCRMALDLHAAECRCVGQPRVFGCCPTAIAADGKPIAAIPACGQAAGRDARSAISTWATWLRTCCRWCVRRRSHAGVALDCRMASGHLFVSGDEEALSQVVLNLLLNAVEAAQQNGIATAGRSAGVCRSRRNGRPSGRDRHQRFGRGAGRLGGDFAVRAVCH